LAEDAGVLEDLEFVNIDLNDEYDIEIRKTYGDDVACYTIAATPLSNSLHKSREQESISICPNTEYFSDQT